MGRKSKIAFFIFLVLTLAAMYAISINGQEILPSRSFEVQGASLAQAVIRSDCDLIERIETAKRLLQSSPKLKEVETSKKQGKRIVYTTIRKEVTLAILDTKNCDIFERRYWLDESDIKKANALRKGYQDNPGDLPKYMPSDPQNDFTVFVNWWNNHNSDLSVSRAGQDEEGRYIVIGNKFPISSDNLAYPEDQTGGRYSDIVYIPYSAGIHTPELIEKGREFLIKNAAQAFKELEDIGVRSHAYPNLTVVGNIPKTFVKNLFLTEQTDPALIFASNDNGQRLAERVFVRLGANGEKTFRYTYSKTGALGLGQIMPGTYASIVKRYPEAKLKKDIDIGRVEIVNGIKATILVLDDHFATVVQSSSKTSKGAAILAGKTPEQREEIMAAAYNGGPGKYKPLTGNISLAVRETVDFVRKFKMIRDLNLFK